MNQQRTLTTQRGFTALELIIVLVIGFSIIAMSASKMGDLFLSSKITRSVSNILEFASSIKTLQGVNGYGAAGPLNSNLLIGGGLVPKTLKISGGRILNDWNGEVLVEILPNSESFSITYPAIPKGACNKLATALLSSTIFSTLNIDATNLHDASNARDILTACNTPATPAVTFVLTADGAPAAAAPAAAAAAAAAGS